MGSDNALFAKPGREKWHVVRKADDLFEVREPDGKVYGTYATLGQASATAGARQKEADRASSRTVRPCLCCGKPFQSEGIHNRMCTPCRGLNADGWNPYSLAPRSGRAR